MRADVFIVVVLISVCKIVSGKLWSEDIVKEKLEIVNRLNPNFRKDYVKLLRERVAKNVVKPRKLSSDQKIENVCMTPECVQAAAHFLSSMDQSVDPCNNFYNYACGKWIDNAEIPRYLSSYSTFHELEKAHIHDISRYLLTNPAMAPSETERLAMEYYQSCMNTQGIDRLDSEPFFEVLESMGVKMTLLDQRANATPPMEVFEKFLRNTLKANLVEIGISRDESNAKEKSLLVISKPILLNFNTSNPLEFRILKIIAKAKYQITKELAYYWTITRLQFIDSRQLLDDIISVILFELDLSAENSTETNEAKKITFQKLIEILDYQVGDPIDIATALKSLIFDMTDKKITNSTILHVANIPYFRKIAQILRNTDPRIITNFFLYKYFFESIANLGAIMRDLNFQFESFFSEATVPSPRKNYCVSKTESFFGIVISKWFIKSHRGLTIRNQTSRMINKISEAFEQTFEDVEWMDKVTKDNAIIKLKSILRLDVWPPEKLNVPLDEIYKTVPQSFKKGFFIKNWQLEKWLIGRILKELFKKPSATRLRSSFDTMEVNAYYDPMSNSIMIPQGIQFFPFYSHNVLDAINFGGLGSVIGHELTHAFDNNGRAFDKDGNLKNWWSNDTLKKYESKTECFVKQYGKHDEDFFIGNTSAQRTLGENIADNGGLRIAYKAYLKSKKGASSYTLPGLPDITEDQLFFITFGSNWCSLQTIDNLLLTMSYDNHSPSFLRVTETLRNSEEFAKAFNCPAKSNMVSESPCKLW